MNRPILLYAVLMYVLKERQDYANHNNKPEAAPVPYAD